MKNCLVLLPILMLATAATAANKTADPPPDAQAAFDRLKTLAGEWDAETPMGKARLTFEIIASGTALVERETVSGMPPMLTVYHLDGNRLILTHYCMLGNQPRMQARQFDPSTGELDFEFLDATNLPSSRAAHMHNLKIHFAGNNHFTNDVEFYENGERKNTESVQYTRVR